jgi:putative FmdB family regulatory protein
MPIYEYECLTCGVTFEKRQSFSDVPKADCPNGHSETRRLLAAPAIVFKGSGFYINDSKAVKAASMAASKAKSQTTVQKPNQSKSEKLKVAQPSKLDLAYPEPKARIDPRFFILGVT